MWLPSRLYEALPWLYVAFGLAFVVGVAYLGSDTFSSGFYFAFGVFSIASGLIVLFVRSRVRSGRPGPSRSGGDPATS